MLLFGNEHINRKAWQQFALESPTASWFQTPEAYDFYASLPEMMTPFVVAVSRKSSATCKDDMHIVSCDINASTDIKENTVSYDLKGLILGYITCEHNSIKQYFSRRAIIYGGPLLAADILDEELQSLLLTLGTWLRKKAIYIETRNFSDYSRWRSVFEQCDFRYQQHFDMFIDCSDHDGMLARIHDSKLRQIRKLQNEGVEITEAVGVDEIREYYELLKQLYKTKVRTPLFPFEFFTTFVAQKRGVLLLAKQNGTVIGGILCPIFNGKVLYEWYVVGPAIVTWAAMDYANNHGLPLFDLMGAGEPDVPYGVRDFKMQFGGELHEFGRFICVKHKLLYNLGKIIISINKLF